MLQGLARARDDSLRAILDSVFATPAYRWETREDPFGMLRRLWGATGDAMDRLRAQNPDAVRLLTWLLAKGDLDPDRIGRALRDPKLIALALLLATVNISTSAVRWLLLLRSEGIECSLRLALRLTWIGHFWNMVIPGAVSGDAVLVGAHLEADNAKHPSRFQLRALNPTSSEHRFFPEAHLVLR